MYVPGPPSVKRGSVREPSPPHEFEPSGVAGRGRKMRRPETSTSPPAFSECWVREAYLKSCLTWPQLDVSTATSPPTKVVQLLLSGAPSFES